MTDSLPRSGSAPMTGPLKVQPGSASSPSIAPSSNPSIGFWFDNAGVHVAGNLVGARYIGELIPWTRVTAPALCVLPYGQTLLRSAYPDLWAIAQAEIAAGNSFYNNGNGTTTFGIGDLRGRVIAGNDSMGGTAANRITAGNFGATPSIIGSFGGTETKTLSTSNFPPYTPTGSITNGAISINGGGYATTSITQITINGSTPVIFAQGSLTASQAASTFTGTPQGGTSTPLSIMQPTIICNFALYAGA